MARGDPMELDFPLRQHHIAVPPGLLSHVSKVLSDFRRNALVKLSERSLTILDLARFRRIANTRRKSAKFHPGPAFRLCCVFLRAIERKGPGLRQSRP